MNYFYVLCGTPTICYTDGFVPEFDTFCNGNDKTGGRFINCMFVVCLTQWDLNKTDSILQTFSYTLSFNTVLDFDLNVSEVYFLWYNWQQASIGWGDGFAPTRRQTIIWANDDPIHWHMYASLGTDDLNKLILANSKIV